MGLKFTFETDCVGSTYDLISTMRDNAVDSSLEELRADCLGLDRVFRSLGYDEDFTIDGDWHVSYHRSTYDGRPCRYFVWSAFEYIFVADIAASFPDNRSTT